MRKYLIIAIFLLAQIGYGQTNPLPGQYAGTMSAAGTTCFVTNACIVAPIPTAVGLISNSASFVISANASGNTIQFEQSGDGGVTWVALSASPQPSGSSVTNTTGTGTWTASVAAMTFVRMRMSTLVSGTTTGNIQLSPAVSSTNGNLGVIPITSGGTGAITATAGFSALAPTVVNGDCMVGSAGNWVAGTCASNPNTVSVFNPVANGADPTGVADSGAAINTTITNCGTNGGGIVMLPVGTYLVTTAITMNQANCSLAGIYRETTLKNNQSGAMITISASNLGIRNLIMDCTTTACNKVIATASSPTDLTIDGNNIKSNWTSGGGSIQLNSVSRALVTNNTVVTAGQAEGIKVLNNSKDVRVVHNYIDISGNSGGNGDALTGSASGSTNVLNRITFEDNDLHIGRTGGGNQFCAESGAFVGQTIGVSFLNNRCVAINGYKEGFSLVQNTGATVIGNIFDTNGQAGGPCYELAANTFSTLNNNVCLGGNNTAGATFGITCQACSYDSFAGNTIFGFAANGGSQAGISMNTGTAGVALLASASCTESGNTATCTTNVSLPSFITTGAVVYVAGVSVAGYNSPANAGWTVTSFVVSPTNTFTFNVPSTGLGTGNGGTVGQAMTGNSVVGNVVHFPEGATTGANNYYGILSNCNAADAACSNNRYADNDIYGTKGGGGTEIGIAILNPLGLVADSDAISENTIVNTDTGIAIGSSGVTNARIGRQQMSAVTTRETGVAGGNTVNLDSPCLLGSQTTPIACVDSAQGRIGLSASAGATIVVDTTAVQANSIVIIQPTTDNSGIPGAPVCASQALSAVESTRTAGVSFSFTSANPATIQCFTYQVIN